MSELQKLRFCGLTGVSAALLLLTSDWLMLGTLTDARSFNDEWLLILGTMPPWRVVLGAITGPLGAWLYLIGFWQVYVAVQPASTRLAFTCWAGLSLAFVYIAGALHSSFPFLAHVARTLEFAEQQGGRTVLEGSAIHALHYSGMLFIASALPALVGCTALAYAVLALPTRYPRWAVAFNPLVLFLGTLLFRFVPAPLGGLLSIGYGNILFLVFFAVSTKCLWHGGRLPAEHC